MNPAEPTLAASPSWHRQTRPRLIASMALSAAMLVALVFLLRFDADAPLELQVTIVPDEAAEVQPVPLDEIPMPSPQARSQDLKPPPVIADPGPESVAPSRDWQALTQQAVKEIVAEQLNPAAVNPGFDERRRHAAAQFAPSQAPQRKPIWENVETDQLGRKILVSGDCHRVIDDPNPANYETFRTFHQYLVFCTRQKSAPEELPWVDEIRNSRDYLARGEDTRTDLYVRLK